MPPAAATDPAPASTAASAATSVATAAILPYLTVAVGASAGGLQAFTSFLAAVPPAADMAFVLIQHLAPSHDRLLARLLAPHTGMPVTEAIDGMALAPDRVFVIPPNATMTVAGGRLHIARPAPERAHRHPIDTFFASLAADQRQHCVCIVLSGSGSDGSHALREVRQAGGLVLAQADDNGSPVARMPANAVTTGLVNQVLAVEAMANRLLDHQSTLGEAVPGQQRRCGGDDGAATLRPGLCAAAQADRA